MIERYTRPEMGGVWTEAHKLESWWRVELAACEAWAREGVVPADDLERLRQARFSLADVDRYQRETHHDVTAFLRSLADSLGTESRFIHLGLTSSDVIDTALSLQLLEAHAILQRGVERLTKALGDQALKYRHTLQAGRTHGVHAEPITFGLKLALWYDEMRRNARRLAAVRETIAVGKISGAVGTHATVPPSVEDDVCRQLGLAAAPVSNQVLQRDRHAEFVQCLALIAASLEKFATEIRALQKTEVREVEEPFVAGQTGSSAMPHKRNPEKCERVCGLARVIRGYATTALENVALWHERDISHSSAERIIVPDACILLDYVLDLFAGIIENLLVYPERMLGNLEITHGLLFSQRVLLALIEKGLQREQAYGIVQRNAMECWRTGRPFRDLLEADPEAAARLSASDLDSLFDYEYYLRHVDVAFERIGLVAEAAV
jgi:adenylosuccinate lyase